MDEVSTFLDHSFSDIGLTITSVRETNQKIIVLTTAIKEISTPFSHAIFSRLDPGYDALTNNSCQTTVHFHSSAIYRLMEEQKMKLAAQSNLQLGAGGYGNGVAVQNHYNRHLTHNKNSNMCWNIVTVLFIFFLGIFLVISYHKFPQVIGYLDKVFNK